MPTVSSNFAAIIDLAGAGSVDLATILGNGNITDGSDIVFSSGDGVDTALNGGGAGFDLNIAAGDAGGGVFAGGDLNLTPGLGSGGGTNGTVNINGDLVVTGTLTLSNLLTGAGSPEGVIVAAIGSIFQRTNGSAGNTIYFKQANTGLDTGWVPAGPRVREDFTSVGAAAFVTSRGVFSDLVGLGIANLFVYWNGLLQRGGDDFTVAFDTPGPGMTTCTFVVIPPSGDFITLEYLPE